MNVFTYSAWLGKGRQVMKGQRGTRVVLTLMIERKAADGSPRLKDGRPDVFPVSRAVSLFHESQTKPIGAPDPDAPADLEQPAAGGSQEHAGAADAQPAPVVSREEWRRRYSGARFDDFREMESRKASTGCVNDPDHQIGRGDVIGWSRRHRVACCAKCWDAWSRENAAAAEDERFYAGLY